jgi:hypothetical protein
MIRTPYWLLLLVVSGVFLGLSPAAAADRRREGSSQDRPVRHRSATDLAAPRLDEDGRPLDEGLAIISSGDIDFGASCNGGHEPPDSAATP